MEKLSVFCRIKPTRASNFEVSNSWLKADGVTFDFDQVLGSSATQEHTFKAVCLPLVNQMMSGTSSCLFVLGTQNSGRSYTLFGTDEALIYKAAEMLLENCYDKELRVSASEVYMDTVVDLIADEEASPLSLLETPIMSLLDLEFLLEEIEKNSACSSKFHKVISLKLCKDTRTFSSIAFAKLISFENVSSCSSDLNYEEKRNFARTFNAVSEFVLQQSNSDNCLMQCLQEYLQDSSVSFLCTVVPDNSSQTLASLKYCQRLMTAKSFTSNSEVSLLEQFQSLKLEIDSQCLTESWFLTKQKEISLLIGELKALNPNSKLQPSSLVSQLETLSTKLSQNPFATIQELRSILAKSESLQNEYCCEITRLENLNYHYSEAASKFEAQITELEKQLREETQAAELNSQNLKKQIEERDYCIEQLKTSENYQVTQLETQCNNLTQKKKQKSKLLKEANQAIHEKNLTIQELTLKLKTESQTTGSLQKQHNQQLEALEKTQSENKELNIQVSSLEEKNKELQKKLSTAKEESNSKKLKSQKFSERLSEIEELVSNLTEQNKQLKLENKQLKLENSNLKQQNSQTSQKLELETQVKLQLNKEVEKLSLQLKETSTKSKEDQKLITKLKTETPELQNKLKLKTKKLKKLKVELQETQEKSRVKTSKLENQINKLENLNENLQTRLSEEKEIQIQGVVDLETKINQVEEELTSIRNQKTNLEANIKDLKAQLKESQSSVIYYKNQKEELEFQLQRVSAQTQDSSTSSPSLTPVKTDSFQRQQLMNTRIRNIHNFKTFLKAYSKD